MWIRVLRTISSMREVEMADGTTRHEQTKSISIVEFYIKSEIKIKSKHAKV